MDHAFSQSILPCMAFSPYFPMAFSHPRVAPMGYAIATIQYKCSPPSNKFRSYSYNTPIPMDVPPPPLPPLSSPSRGSGTGIRFLRAAVMIVLLGYIMLWIMMPTNTWAKVWRPNLRAQTTSTYFGPTQGANYLVFTFPVLLVSVFGCFYIHLGNKSKNSGVNNKGRQWATLKRPMIIKGLGIISRIELFFLVMFMALLIWSFAAYLKISFGQMKHNSGEKMWEAHLEKSGLYLGIVGNIALSFLFFPVTRGSSVLPIFGLSSEASIKYHIWLGHTVMIIFTAHGLSYIVYWAATQQIIQLLKWKKTGVANIAGEISLLAGLILWAATFRRIRRRFFEVFLYTHHLYILFIIFFVLHVGISYASVMLPGFFLFAIDRYLRFLQSRRDVRLLSVRILPCQTLELNFSKTKTLNYSATSIMFVNVPSISKLQWHPFTVVSSSNLESEKLSIVVKTEGSWSDKLYQLLSSTSTSIDRLQVSVEGPYGPNSTSFLRHDLLVMISGGSGLTPFISIIRELIHKSKIFKEKTPKILLISAFKSFDDLTMLDLILPISDTQSEFLDMGIQIEAYVTREQQPIMTQGTKPIRTLWFKPNPSDAPIAPILGENSWLWLAAIISSSFVMYLIVIGLLTRFYIYPIDHNTNQIYASYPRSLLHMLFLCISIVVVSTAAFLWNKSTNAGEKAQIQSIDGATPQASPSSWYYNKDRELESFLQESLSQYVNVHYGQRPDVKGYLSQRQESSVGVLVSGPKKMRHEVAKICSSGLADNLHFESVSFSW